MEKIDNVVEFFCESEFQNKIKQEIHDIETSLYEFINQEDKKSQKMKISKTIISRLKDKESFREKLFRKNYVNVWNIDTLDKNTVQKAICEKFPDLIGFRINCYFKNDEQIIFDQLLKYLSKKKCFNIEENPNNKQKNGHDIYKIVCKYIKNEEIFSFEVQVKSLLNDIWGEVEHSIIYKEKSYDSRENLKTNVIDGIYSILDGTDKQLSELYSFNSSVKEIKHELFYEYSKQNFQESNNVLGKHYNNFFDLTMYIKDVDEHIDHYLGKKLLKQEFIKKRIDSIDIVDKNFDKYKKNFDEYKCNMFCSIANVLYEYESKDHFMKYIVNQIYSIVKADDDDFEFIDQEEKDREDEIFNTIMQSLSCIRKNNIEDMEE